MGNYRPPAHGLPPRYRLEYRVRFNMDDRPRAVVVSHPEIQLSLDHMLRDMARRARQAKRKAIEREAGNAHTR